MEAYEVLFRKPGLFRILVAASANGNPIQYTRSIVQKDLSGQYKSEIVE